MAINVNNCTVSRFVSKPISQTGFDSFAKPVSDLHIECTKTAKSEAIFG